MAIPREGWTPSPFSHVCLYHFKKTDFCKHKNANRLRLKPTAVPSIFDPLLPRRSCLELKKSPEPANEKELPPPVRALCRLCLQQLDDGPDARCPDNEMSQLYAQLTGARLPHPELHPTEAGWCVPCAQKMRQAVETLDKCHKTSTYWSDYMQKRSALVPVADECSDNYAIIELKVEMGDDATAEINWDPHDENNTSDHRAYESCDQSDHHHPNDNKPSRPAPVRRPLPPQVCFKCGIIVQNLQLHMESAHAELTCDMCGRTFVGKAQMREHFKNDHRPAKVFECQVCQKSYSQQTSLYAHKRARHMRCDAKCDECGKVFFNQFKLRYHQIRHGPKKIKCTVDGCPTMFWFTKDLLVHRRIVHEQIRRFECQLCGKRFKWNAQLKKHTELGRCGGGPGVGPLDGRLRFQPHAEYKCESCGKVFPVKAYLTKHHKFGWCPGPNGATTNRGKGRQIMDRSRQFKCEVCGKAYLVKAFLEKHQTRGLCRGRPGARATTAAMSLGGQEQIMPPVQLLDVQEIGGELC